MALSSKVPVGERVESRFFRQVRAALRAQNVSPRRVRLRRGQLIPLSECRNSSLHLVDSGCVKLTRISKDGRLLILGLAAKGDVFGEMGVLGFGAEDATYAEAIEPTELDAVPGPWLECLLRSRPLVALSLAELCGEKRSALERRLESRVFSNVPTRLATELLELAGNHGTRGPSGTRIDVRLSQNDLGHLIGASREMVSLTLSDFRRRGLVFSEGRHLVVHEAVVRRQVFES